MDTTRENRPPERGSEKRPNLGPRKGNLEEKIAKNSENWAKKIGVIGLKKASIHRVKTVFWAILLGGVLGIYMAGIIELWGRLAIPYPLPLKSLVEEVKMGRTGPPYKRTEKRPNSCSRREKFGGKLAKNSQKLFKKIALEKRKSPSIYQGKMQFSAHSIWRNLGKLRGRDNRKEQGGSHSIPEFGGSTSFTRILGHWPAKWVRFAGKLA